MQDFCGLDMAGYRGEDFGVNGMRGARKIIEMPDFLEQGDCAQAVPCAIEKQS